MLNFLAVLALSLSPQVVGTDPCAHPPTFTPPAVLPQCDGTWNQTCLDSIAADFNRRMQRAWQTACRRSVAAWADYDVTVHDCESAYQTCLANGGTTLECGAARTACMDSAATELSDELTAIARQRSTMETTITNTWRMETEICCTP
jgi:hypothetical protein